MERFTIRTHYGGFQLFKGTGNFNRLGRLWNEYEGLSELMKTSSVESLLSVWLRAKCLTVVWCFAERRSSSNDGKCAICLLNVGQTYNWGNINEASSPSYFRQFQQGQPISSSKRRRDVSPVCNGDGNVPSIWHCGWCRRKINVVGLLV